jgi:uncharacterized membrane protein
MKFSDIIVGVALIISGTIIYLTNYRQKEKQSKLRARVGLGVVMVGTLLGFGDAIFRLILSGR